jgi:hypothetical protein
MSIKAFEARKIDVGSLVLKLSGHSIHRMLGKLTRYNSINGSPSSRDRRSSSRGKKYIGNSETFTSPSTPSSSRILLDTKVRLGTQNIDISCSTDPFFCIFLICPVSKDKQLVSASNKVEKENVS